MLSFLDKRKLFGDQTVTQVHLALLSFGILRIYRGDRTAPLAFFGFASPSQLPEDSRVRKASVLLHRLTALGAQMSSLHPAVAFADDADGSAVDLGDDGSVDLGLAHAEGKRSEDEEASLFDTIVGVLQSALLRIRPEVESFCLAHCDVFEAAAENKLQYMDVYTRYSRMIEEHLERSLAGES